MLQMARCASADMLVGNVPLSASQFTIHVRRQVVAYIVLARQRHSSNQNRAKSWRKKEQAFALSGRLMLPACMLIRIARSLRCLEPRNRFRVVSVSICSKRAIIFCREVRESTLVLQPRVTFSSAFFPLVYPNIPEHAAGLFGGWMLWC